MPDGHVEGRALEGEILPQVLDVDGDLVEMRSFRAGAHNLPPFEDPGTARV